MDMFYITNIFSTHHLYAERERERVNNNASEKGFHLPPAGARCPSSQSGAELSSSQSGSGLVSPQYGAGIYSPPKNYRMLRKRRAKALPFFGAGLSSSPSNTGLQSTSYRLRTRNAFTLIELLVVISIIGLLASVVVTSLGSAREKAKIAKAKADGEQIIVAAEMFYSDHGYYPDDNTCPDSDFNATYINKWPCDDVWGYTTDWDNWVGGAGRHCNCDTDPGRVQLHERGPDHVWGTADDYRFIIRY